MASGGHQPVLQDRMNLQKPNIGDHMAALQENLFSPANPPSMSSMLRLIYENAAGLENLYSSLGIPLNMAKKASLFQGDCNHNCGYKFF